MNLSKWRFGVVIADAQGIGTILDNDVNRGAGLGAHRQSDGHAKDNFWFNATATDPAAPRRSRSRWPMARRARDTDRRHYRCWHGPVHLDADGSARAGSYTFDVVVTDSGTPALSDRDNHRHRGRRQSSAALQAIPESDCHGRQLLTFTASGHRSGHPGQRLDLQQRWSGGAQPSIRRQGLSWTPTNAQPRPAERYGARHG